MKLPSALRSTRIDNFAPLLPSLLTLDRKPMSLEDFFVFVPIFSTGLPPDVTLRAGRQLGKTHQTSGRLILQLAAIPGFKILVVTPLQEQSDRLSATVFKPMVDDSPIRAILGVEGTMGSVRRRRFANGSLVYFSYAWLDTDRVRQINANWLYVDEAQDMDPAHVPVIKECLSSKLEPMVFVSGTSKTKGTFLEDRWEHSSQGVWHVECDACGFDNVCALEPDGHILSMIGPVRDDISEERPGTLCHRCRTPVVPRRGRWRHRYPERVRDHVGYFVPQPVMPIHYSTPSKWAQLVGKMNGGDGYTTARFYNEILGEAYDDASKLISETDLRKACTGVGPNDEAKAMHRASAYPLVVLGVDWGGDGSEGVSRTKVAAVGFNYDGSAEVFFGAQFQPSTDAMVEGREVLRLAVAMKAKLVAHDANGAITREAVMNSMGWPAKQLVPCVYRSVVGGDMIEYQAPQKNRTRGYWVLDKGRILDFVCAAIKVKQVTFFDWDYVDSNRPGLVYDFMALVINRVETPTGRSFRVVKLRESMSDDFAHSCAFALASGWELLRSWPNVTGPGRVRPV